MKTVTFKNCSFTGNSAVGGTGASAVMLSGGNATMEGCTVTGNTCPRGDDYARKECTAPERTVTGTVRVIGGSAPVVSVRTSRPIPKEKVLELARLMAKLQAQAPICPGDVLAADVLGTGADLLATCGASID